MYGYDIVYYHEDNIFFRQDNEVLLSKFNLICYGHVLRECGPASIHMGYPFNMDDIYMSIQQMFSANDPRIIKTNTLRKISMYQPTTTTTIQEEYDQNENNDIHKNHETFGDIHKNHETFADIHKNHETFGDIHKNHETFCDIHKNHEMLGDIHKNHETLGDIHKNHETLGDIHQKLAHLKDTLTL